MTVPLLMGGGADRVGWFIRGREARAHERRSMPGAERPVFRPYQVRRYGPPNHPPAAPPPANAPVSLPGNTGSGARPAASSRPTRFGERSGGGRIRLSG